MTEVFVVRNQLGHYWGKGNEWVDGTEPRAVMRAKHEDEAVNTLFELSSKDIELRGEVTAVQLTEKNEVIVEPSAHLLPKKTDTEPETITPDSAEPEASAPDSAEPELQPVDAGDNIATLDS
ncbi:MAG: hypothetical protein Hals2KO_09780 [Halioglobus sp.]